MNDRYLFRGKRIDNGEWVEGCLWTFSDVSRPRIVIERGDVYVIDPATIGQCTGLKDRNGKLIFDGDVISTNSGTGVIKSKRGYVYFYFKYSKSADWDGLDEFLASKYTDYGDKEIIGNIHDNPELMEGAK